MAHDSEMQQLMAVQEQAAKRFTFTLVVGAVTVVLLGVMYWVIASDQRTSEDLFLKNALSVCETKTQEIQTLRHIIADQLELESQFQVKDPTLQAEIKAQQRQLERALTDSIAEAKLLSCDHLKP